MTKPSHTSQTRSEVASNGLIEIFRAGRHTDMHGRSIEFTADDLKVIAEGYDPELSPAPIVVGHPKTDDPAYGWHTRLVADGNSLFAEEDQVDEAFNDLRKAGRFKNRSASFYLPDAPNNPTPGRLYLKHVGHLGAAAPAVKGLKPLNFAAGEEGVVEFALDDRRWGFRSAARVIRGIRDHFIETLGKEKADAIVPEWEIESLNQAAQDDDISTVYSAPTGAEEIDVTDKDKTAEFAERETKLTTDTAALATREKALADREAKAAREDTTSFVDGLVDAGQVLPKDKATVVAVLLAQPAAPLAFADGDDQIEKPAAELLRTFLSGLPKQIEFGEKAGSDTTLDFADPNAIARAASDYQDTERKAGRTISVVDAVNHVTKGKR